MYTGPIESYRGVLIYRSCDSAAPDKYNDQFRCTIGTNMYHTATLEGMRARIDRVLNRFRRHPGIIP